MDSRKDVLHETLIVLLGEAVCLALMLAVFALLGYFDRTVLLGGVLGSVLAVGNFFFMALNLSVAADKAAAQDVSGGKAVVRFSYVGRLAVIFVILLALVKSGLCHPIASVLPLVFVRGIITVAEFFRRKGDA